MIRRSLQPGKTALRCTRCDIRCHSLRGVVWNAARPPGAKIVGDRRENGISTTVASLEHCCSHGKCHPGATVSARTRISTVITAEAVGRQRGSLRHARGRRITRTCDMAQLVTASLSVGTLLTNRSPERRRPCIVASLMTCHMRTGRQTTESCPCVSNTMRSTSAISCNPVSRTAALSSSTPTPARRMTSAWNAPPS